MRTKFLILLIALLLAACGGSAAPTEEGAPTVEPSATAEPTPVFTPTPGLPLAVLLVPADANHELSQAYQTAIYDLAQAQSMRFQVLNSLDPATLDPSLKVVVALVSDPGIATLAAAAPQAQFLAVNIPGIAAGGNISVLGGDGIRIDQQAFMAGYISAMITEDFHTGIIIRKDDPAGRNAYTAFQVGQEFFCGLCNPLAGPFLDYPLVIEIPADAKPNEYGAYADYLIRNRVETMFIQDAVAIPELLEYLNTVGIFVIGMQTPPIEVNGWVVTLQPNYLEAMQTVWPQLLAGNGGQNFQAPLTLTDINEEVFTEGKEGQARQILQQLMDGFIFTGVQ